MQNSAAKPTGHSLSIDVIVIFNMNEKTVGPLSEADDAPANPLLPIDGIQGCVKIDVPYSDTTTYDEMMDAVEAEVRRRTKKVLGLGVSAIAKISTCADWDAWDQVTGRDSNAEDAGSVKWKNGKRHF